MDLGFDPKTIIDMIVGGIFWIFNFVKDNFWNIYNYVLELVGGNPIVAGIVIGFPVYIVLDFIYHSFVDRPAATFGATMMNFARNAVLFIIVFVVAMWMMKGGL